jgi:hypothetical protein
MNTAKSVYLFDRAHAEILYRPNTFTKSYALIPIKYVE